MAFEFCKHCEKAFDSADETTPGQCPHCGCNPNSRPSPHEPEENTAKIHTSTLKSKRAPCEWELNGSNTPVSSFFKTAFGVIQSPIQTFETLAPFRNMGAACLYIVIAASLASIAAGINQILWGMITGKHIIQSLLTAGIGVIITPVIVIPIVFCTSGIYHLFLMMIVDSEKEFRMTFSVYALCQSLSLLAFVPLVGSILVGVFALVAHIGGMAKAHEMPVSKSLVVYLLPMCLCCVTAGGIAFTAIFLAGMLFPK